MTLDIRKAMQHIDKLCGLDKMNYLCPKNESYRRK